VTGLVSSTQKKKNDHYDITEILLKVALNTIKQTIFFMYCKFHFNTTIYIAGGLIGTVAAEKIEVTDLPQVLSKAMSDPVNVTPPMYVPKNKNVLITLAAGSVMKCGCSNK
jgi:NAD/NADP transhydrogenase beta subunit